MVGRSRGTCLNNGPRVREIRKLTHRGHQAILLAADYPSALGPVAGAMLDRSSQENLFRNAREHFGLGRRADYGAEPNSDPILAANPAIVLP